MNAHPSVCNHTFVFLRTAKWTDMRGNYNTGFFRVDTFFCSKCLEEKTVKKSEYHRETPDWYRDGDSDGPQLLRDQ